MKSKEEENEKLKIELEHLKLNRTADTATSSNIESMEGQIFAFKAEMSELQERIGELSFSACELRCSLFLVFACATINSSCIHFTTCSLSFTSCASFSLSIASFSLKDSISFFSLSCVTSEIRFSAKELSWHIKCAISNPIAFWPRLTCIPCSSMIDSKDVELKLERREKERAEKELKLLQHRIALLEKNSRIKNVDEQKLSKPKK